jgi:hypothetical protein
MEVIYLGPMGRLMKIDMPSGGYEANLVEYGGEHVPLSGRRTKDVFSRRMEFKVATDGLTPMVLSWFEMLYTGAVTGPLYLLESSRVNKLRARISSTGSAPLALNALSTDWTFAGTSLTQVAATTLLLPAGSQLTPGPSKALQWVSSATNQVVADTALIPVTPGQVLVFSAFVQAGTPSLEIVPYNAALAPQAPVAGATVIAGTPPRRYVTYTVPTNGTIVAVSVQLRSAAASTYTTVGWQIEEGALPGPWVLGAGSPQVLFLENATGDRQPVGRYTGGTYTLKEV